MILWELFSSFFKIGAFTFGGGYAMLPLIQEEVLRRGWVSQADIVNFIAVSESTPGPFAVNIATYIGITTAGILGAVFATLGVILPSFLIILAVARFFQKFSENKLVKGIMNGLKPAVIGLIASAILSVGKTTLFPEGYAINTVLIVSISILVLSLILAFKKLHPIYIILISAVLGIVSGFYLQI